MNNLSGFFAGVIEIAVEDQHTDALIKEISAIEEMQTQVVITNPPETTPQATIVLELTANDRAGIIQDISAVIHHQNGNLIKLVSKQDNAAHSGQLMFKAKATIAVPENNIEPLIEALENLADDLMVDISR